MDTSIIANIASKFRSLKAITVAFQNAPAPDVEYATLMANNLGLKHVVHFFNEYELHDTLPLVIKVTKSFDPMEIRNSVVIYIGMKVAKEIGIRTILTGDGCDELFAGYNYLFGLEKEKLDMKLKKLCSMMTFSSISLAKVLRMQAKLPFLDSKLKDFALNIHSQYKVHTENGKIHGKWILRKTYEGILPRAIAWRVKTPIEVGSGTTILPDFFNQKISDIEFLDKKKNFKIEDRVTIRDKEQLFYYEIYKSVIGTPHPVDENGKICPQCNSNVQERATYCRTCGAYPL
ncbi:MAG: hypothetical protein HWN65_14270 [Candidatus Helarchaeota archaeon]|nr:hypothetical protein [Candidatus Helarchaeota archaeon]